MDLDSSVLLLPDLVHECLAVGVQNTASRGKTKAIHLIITELLLLLLKRHNLRILPDHLGVRDHVFAVVEHLLLVHLLPGVLLQLLLLLSLPVEVILHLLNNILLELNDEMT